MSGHAIITAADLPAVVDCGHAPQPTYYSGAVTVLRDDGVTESVDATGRIMFPGWAVTPDGRRICPDCADNEQRARMLEGRRTVAYLSADGRSVTTWTGGKLGTVTRHTANSRQTFVRVVVPTCHSAGW